MKLIFFCKKKTNLIISLALLTALALISFLTSCHKEVLLDGSIPVDIAAYRTFYEEQMHKSETKGRSNIPHRSPQWRKGTIQKWYRGYAVVTPLDYNENYFIRISTSSYSMNLGSASFLMVNKGRDGSMQGEIVYLIPDGQATQSGKGGQSRFSGTIVVESLHGEFLAAYICQPDGRVIRYGASDVTTSQKKEDSKSLECFIYELWQISSLDGGETWSNPTLISSHMECYNIPDSYSEVIAYDYYDLGGGGSSTPQSFRPLSADEIQKLESVRISISEDCATNKVLNTVWGNLSFNVNSSISNPAQYNCNNNTITFRNSSNINENNILEELFHAYQNTIYPGGTCQYSLGKPGFTNIEFEAKLFTDIYAVLYGGAYSASIGLPGSIEDEYADWVRAITEQGFTPALMEQYSTMLGYFNQYNSFYGGYLLPELDTPLAIIQSKSGCN